MLEHFLTANLAQSDPKTQVSRNQIWREQMLPEGPNLRCNLAFEFRVMGRNVGIQGVTLGFLLTQTDCVNLCAFVWIGIDVHGLTLMCIALLCFPMLEFDLDVWGKCSNVLHILIQVLILLSLSLQVRWAPMGPGHRPMVARIGRADRSDGSTRRTDRTDGWDGQTDRQIYVA
jgi:hypothetical protein